MASHSQRLALAMIVAAAPLCIELRRCPAQQPPSSAGRQDRQTSQNSSAPDGRLICTSRDRQAAFAIDDSGQATRLERVPPAGVVRPDGSAWAFLAVEGRGAESRDVLLLQRRDESAPRRTVLEIAHPGNLQWHPDGRLLLEGSLGARRGVFAVDPDAAASTITRLSPGDRDCQLAAVSSTGSIAWGAVTSRQGKSTLMEIMLREGEAERRLMVDVPATSLAFSPDGRRLAVGRLGGIHVLDVATGAELQRWELHALDEQLYAHHPDAMVWSPDGRTLAFTCRFSGGRAAAQGGELPSIYGDREVFLLIPDTPRGPRLVVGRMPVESGAIAWRAGASGGK